MTWASFTQGGVKTIFLAAKIYGIIGKNPSGAVVLVEDKPYVIDQSFDEARKIIDEAYIAGVKEENLLEGDKDCLCQIVTDVAVSAVDFTESGGVPLKCRKGTKKNSEN